MTNEISEEVIMISCWQFICIRAEGEADSIYLACMGIARQHQGYSGLVERRPPRLLSFLATFSRTTAKDSMDMVSDEPILDTITEI